MNQLLNCREKNGSVSRWRTPAGNQYFIMYVVVKSKKKNFREIIIGIQGNTQFKKLAKNSENT